MSRSIGTGAREFFRLSTLEVQWDIGKGAYVDDNDEKISPRDSQYVKSYFKNGSKRSTNWKRNPTVDNR